MMSHKGFNPVVKISKLGENRIRVHFSYNPEYVQKIKTIDGYRWHPDSKYWSFPNTNGTLGKILKVFDGKKIDIDPVLESTIHREKEIPSPLVGEDKGEGYFQDLKRELLSRKYSYKTIKAYIYFNRDFLKFTGKKSTDINAESSPLFSCCLRF